MRAVLLAVLLAFASTGPLAAEDSVDSLFENPAPDGVADPAQGLTVNALLKKSVRFFETMTAEGYYIGGWSELTGRWEQTPYNALTFGFGTDARLDKNIRAYAAFQMIYPSINEEEDNLYNPFGESFPDSNPELKFSNVQVKELFLDYALGDLFFLRIGREASSWGQGRVFNPTNFVGSLSGGIGAKVSFDLFGVTLSALAMKNDGYFGLDTSSLEDIAGLDTLGLAAKAEGTLGPVSGGLSGFHHANVGDKAAGYLKASVLGFDLFGEGLVEWKRTDNQLSGEAVPSALIGVFREFGGPKPWLQLQVEYLASGRNGSQSAMVVPADFADLSDQSLGVAGSSNLLGFLKTKPSLAWLHSLQDDSGQLIFGLTNTALPHIDLTAGVLWIYGPDDGRYVVNNPDDNALGRKLLLTLKASFALEIEN